MDSHQVSEKQTRRRSRTVSWDHSVRADGEPLTYRTTTDRSVLSPQVGTSFSSEVTYDKFYTVNKLLY